MSEFLAAMCTEWKFSENLSAAPSELNLPVRSARHNFITWNSLAVVRGSVGKWYRLGYPSRL